MIRLILAAALVLAACKPAHAQERMAGFGLACDTKEQVVRFVEVFEGNTIAAVDRVNAEHGKDACILAALMFEKGATVATAENAQGVFDIVEIRVHAAHTPIGLAVFEQPAHWFALFQVDRRGI